MIRRAVVRVLFPPALVVASLFDGLTAAWREGRRAARSTWHNCRDELRWILRPDEGVTVHRVGLIPHHYGGGCMIELFQHDLVVLEPADSRPGRPGVVVTGEMVYRMGEVAAYEAAVAR